VRPIHAHGREARHVADNGASARPDDAAAAAISAPADTEDSPRPGPAEGLRVMIQAFSRVEARPRFPMYVRQVRHFMRAFDEAFDERRYGFAGILDALRFGQREGLFRLDRDRQGGVRVHPGAQYQQLTQMPEASPLPDASALDSRPQDAPPPSEAEVGVVQDTVPAQAESPAAPEPPAVEAEAIAPAQAAEAPAPTEAVAAAEPEAAPRTPARKRAPARTRAAARAKKAASPAGGATKKKSVRPRAKKG